MKLKIRTKLLAGFIFVALIGVFIGTVGIVNIRQIDDADTLLYEQATVPLGYMLHIYGDYLNVRVLLHKMLLTDSLAEKQQMLAEIEALSRNSDHYIELYRQTYYNERDRVEFEKLIALKAEYLAVVNPIIALIMDGRRDEALRAINTQGASIAARLTEQIYLIDRMNVGNAEAIALANDKLGDDAFVLLLITMIAGFVLSVLLALWFGVLIVSRPLMRISASLQSGAEQIAAASNQMSSSAQMLANGATEQASSVEETSSSMEELSSMVRQNLANSREASALGEKASGSSQTGFEDMTRMVESMKDIARSSEQVGKVIKLIEDISFQTNILALNAAVEAARAGEAGLGFAVVADEVKNLANRSAEAAKDTAQMIEDSIRKTEEGAQLANRVAESFKELLAYSQKVATMTKEVEASSSQQDTGITQVTQAVVQFDQVVQSNASTAEETASCAEELSGQADSLMTIVTDLTKLVNGSATQLASYRQSSAGYSASAQPAPALAGPKNKLPQGRSGKPVSGAPPASSPAAGTGGKNVTASRSLKIREIRPETVIPFEDDEELTDF